MAEITFNGRKYQVVPIDEFTMDETLILWDYAKLTIDQVADVEGFNSGLMMAIVHISVARAEDEPAKTIRAAIGKTPWPEFARMFTDLSEETEQLPPPDAPAPSSPSSGSGEGSSSTGEPPPDPVPANGSGSLGSATGAISDPRISVP